MEIVQLTWQRRELKFRACTVHTAKAQFPHSVTLKHFLVKFHCTEDVGGWGSLIDVGFESSSVCLHCCLHPATPPTHTPHAVSWRLETRPCFPGCTACRMWMVDDRSLFAALLDIPISLLSSSWARRCLDLGFPQQGCPMPYAPCGG